MAVDSKKTKLLAGAEKYVLQGKIRQAIAEYLKVIQLDPGDSVILNTIGDLYLRQNSVAEANKYFLQVAEKYAADGFFLKAVAVYKKVLNSDPCNCDIISNVALLYGKQGLVLEACAQYMRVIDLLEKNGCEKETREIYCRIVELDPSNIGIQRKLALLYQEEGNTARAQAYWVGTARAQMKAGDFSGALESWRTSMSVASFDMEMLQGLVDCCLKTGDPAAALEPVQKSLEAHPEDLDLQEMLGRVRLTMGDLDAALAAAQDVFAADESRYESFFTLGQTLIDKGDCDQAAGVLDTIIPSLLSRLEPERLVEHFRSLLERHPRHELALIKLASIYSATGNHAGYLETLHEVTDHYLENARPIEALEYIEKILHADPGNERCRELHPKVFAEAYPDMAYTPPVIRQELASAPGVGDIMPDYKAAGGEEAGETVDEVDLLLNYGLLDRALNLLRKLEARNPRDKEVRRRMLSVYKANQKNDEAAKQCLLLAFLYRTEGAEALARNFLLEATQLSPGLALDVDLGEFARRHGVNTAPETPEDIDLSSDAMRSLFEEAAGGASVDGAALTEALEASLMEAAGAVEPDLPDEPLAEGFAAPVPEKPLAEQLREVDFYIQLGFNDEAFARLDEIARSHPAHPEVRVRYEQFKRNAPSVAAIVGGTEPPPAVEPATAEDSLEWRVEAAQSRREQSFGLGTLLDDQDDLSGIQREEGQTKKATIMPNSPSASPSESPAPAVEAAPPSKPSMVNELFADLLAEVSGPVDPAAADASFEEHFTMGVAFSEMELLDDAIREFEAAARTIEMRRGDLRVIQCCERLSHCFLRKNMPKSAVRWCQTGLNLTEKFSHEDMAFRYDMGVAHAMSGSIDQALVCFDQVFDMDPGYRDVAQKIDELKGGSGRHAV